MAEARPLRLLALHGYRQSARRLRQRTGALRKALRGRAELVPIDAPHRLPAGAEDDPDGDDPPRGWWFSGPGTFEAGEAAAAPAGLEESLSAVAAALAEHGPFDGLLGFSQGAALAAMVCALRARGDPRFPVAFAVLVAAFASRAPAHGHFYREPIALPSLHVVGDTDAVIAAALSRELAQCFVEPVVLSHPGGHFIPAAAAQKKAYLEFLERFCPGQGQAERPEAGPSCSSTGKPQRTTKSKFFEDSEDESDEVEEEEEDSEECSEDEDGYSSEEAENEDDEDDTEEAEEDEDEEEEMLLPGMEGKEEPGSDSGTTAVVALIRGKQLIVANAGDSRCVVSEGGKAVDMSYDHKPEDEVELARIKNAGGKVTMDGRVNGGLNLSRAIGDHFYKRNKNLPPEEQMISALPDIKVLTINDDHDFMVIACDGIWNVMSSQEVVDFIQSKITQKDENGVLRPLSSIVEELLDQCLAPDTSGDGTGCDNMTCIIISFKPRNTHPPAESGKRKLGEAAAPAEENGGDSTKKAKLE